MKLKLFELQELNKESRKIRAVGELQGGYKKVNRVLHHQRLLFLLEVVQIKLISQYYDDSSAGYFCINKTRELIGQKYYWLSLRKDVVDYVKGCNVGLGTKAINHKLYSDFQLLPVLIYQWKDLSIDFLTGLPISTN